MRKDWTAGQHSFAQVPSVEIQRSTFDRSCGLRTTFTAGKLIPIFVDEALPGDTFNLRMSAFGRMTTLLHPVMENIHFDYFFFSVPYRLVWNNFQKFMGEQDNPGDSTDYTIPQQPGPIAVGFLEESLQDYMGIPTKTTDLTYSALPFRAYHLLWNQWFRDENLQDSVTVDMDDGPDSYADYLVTLPRGKRHDYFTSCLPFPQKGPSVELPLGTTAPVIGIDGSSPKFNVIGNATVVTLRGISGNTQAQWDTGPTATGNVEWDTTALVANLGSATAATINEIREAFQIQRMYERDARGGSRYVEILRSHFGVISPDQRLQRAEFLGGGTARININPVPATNRNSAQATYVGVLGAFGTSAIDGVGFNHSFTEHCVVLGFVAARADLTYQQGLERMWSRSSRFDFYWPSLSHLGEQEVYNKEIYAQGDANDDLVFGYQERYGEYRYKPSRVSGYMRSNASTSLDTWHLSQDFAALPVLDDTFIVENPPIDRILAIAPSTEPPFLLDAYFDLKCTRPMPVFGVPGLIDHF